MSHRLVTLIWVGLVCANPLVQMATQQNNADGVTVAVTPSNQAVDAKIWKVRVVLDTHTQDLSDDPVQSARLVDSQGSECKPLDWEGDPPRERHRSGVLKFDAFSLPPQSLDLRRLRPANRDSVRFAGIWCR